jgi:hypothetical protein
MKEQDKISLNDRIVNFVSNNIVWVFLGFIVIVIILPRLFIGTSKIGFLDNLKPNEIGDAIGGMTAPIIGLFSAFLVYIAFREQKKANDELVKFNKKQISHNELNEILIQISDLENTVKNIYYFFDDRYIEKKLFKIEGLSAIKNLSGFLLNYKVFKNDEISLWIKETRLINFPYFLNASLLFFKNIYNIYEYIDESNISFSSKRILTTRLVLSYNVTHKDITKLSY